MFRFGQFLLVGAIIFGIWGYFFQPVEISLFQDRLENGVFVDRIEVCGTLNEIFDGDYGDDIDSGIGQGECRRAARADLVFGGFLVLLAAVFGAGITYSNRTPATAMGDVRPLPSRSIFARRSDAHRRRAEELANRQSSDSADQS